MEPTLKTRKPIDRLTVNDLRAFPVWEFAADEEGIEGQDESWVRPLDTRVVPKEGWSLQVAVDLKAVCGRAYSGFVDVATADPFDVNGGVILHESEYLLIPEPRDTDKNINADFQNRLRERLLTRLGLSEAELFPITYTLRVLIDGEQVLRSGTIR